jgi:putative ABC transport system permease protein
MLLGDRAKYIGLVLSIAFSTMLMAQQAAIFWGLMLRTTSQIADVREPDVWVMDPKTTNIDDAKPLKDTDVLQVRGVPGVRWAVPLNRSIVRITVPNGNYRQTLLMGLDDSTLVGGPQEMLLGSRDELRRPETVILDKAGYEYLWPGEPFRLGRVVEINDKRAVVGAICQTSAPFITLPVAYARRLEVARFSPQDAQLTSFVVARAAPGMTAHAVAERVARATLLQARTDTEFATMTIKYYVQSTGIPVNFGITVALAFIVGAAISGQTFLLFTLENLKQFGALKAMGVRNGRILRMVLVQALVVGVLGYGIGLGLATAFFEVTAANVTQLRGFFLYWWVGVGTGALVLLIVLGTALISVRRIFVLEPAVVFRG